MEAFLHQFLGHQLGHGPPQPEIKQTEVADDHPHQGQHAEPVDTQSLDQQRNGKNRHRHWQPRPQHIKERIAGEQPASGILPDCLEGCFCVVVLGHCQVTNAYEGLIQGKSL